MRAACVFFPDAGGAVNEYLNKEANQKRIAEATAGPAPSFVPFQPSLARTQVRRGAYGQSRLRGERIGMEIGITKT